VLQVVHTDALEQSEHSLIEHAEQALASRKNPVVHELQVAPSVLQSAQFPIVEEQAAHVFADKKNPEEQALQVEPSALQSEQEAMEVLHAAQAAPKNPVLQAEQVVPSCEQAVHSAMEVLQAAQEAPKKPAAHEVQVDTSEQASQLAMAVEHERHSLALR
jgi:hypothetical protein